MRTVALRVKHPSWWRGGATSKTESHTGGKHFLPRLLHQAKTAIRSKALQFPRLVLAHVQGSWGQRQALFEEHFYVPVVGGASGRCILHPRFNAPLYTSPPLKVGVHPSTRLYSASHPT